MPNISKDTSLPTNPSKEDIIDCLRGIKHLGWVTSRRPGNAGSVGNTLEDYLGISENNIASADAGEWEIKSQRKGTSSLITLFHFEPEPRSSKVVSDILLPNYGWPHLTIPNEKSFRATLNGLTYTDRGFKIIVDRTKEKVFITFSKDHVAERHRNWLRTIIRTVGTNEIEPQPFWSFESLKMKVSNKIKSTIFVIAKNRIINGIEEFYYDKILVLSNLDFNEFLNCLEKGIILIDFDARTGHNHGTKFRVKQDKWPKFFDNFEEII